MIAGNPPAASGNSTNITAAIAPTGELPLYLARAVTTANVTLSGLITSDGEALAEGDPVLVRMQTTGAQNALYRASSSAWQALTRPGDRFLVEVAKGSVLNRGFWITIDGTTFAHVTGIPSDGSVTMNSLAVDARRRLMPLPVRAVITSDLDGALSGAISSASSDGVTLVHGARIAYTVDSNPVLNGIYIYSTAGAWMRTDDAIRAGSAFDVEFGGAVYGGRRIYCRNVTDPVIGTDQIFFATHRAIPTDSAGGDLTGNYPAPTIAAGAVTSTKIAASAVTTTKLASGAVTTAKIADDAITPAEIADNAVTTPAIADNNVTAEKLAADVRVRLGIKAVRAVVAVNRLGDFNGPFPSSDSDDITLGDGDRIAITGESDATLNGFYIYHTSGPAVRTSDVITAGVRFQVQPGGTYYGGREMYCVNLADPAIGVDSVLFGFPIGECLTDGTTILNSNSRHSVINRTNIQMIDVYVDGVLISTRSRVNFVSGGGLTFTGTDNPTEDRVDISIS
ncbi:MAG: hypothetical protein ABIR47_14590 [Candidatus Kapaibacterium sp.]